MAADAVTAPDVIVRLVRRCKASPTAPLNEIEPDPALRFRERVLSTSTVSGVANEILLLFVLVSIVALPPMEFDPAPFWVKAPPRVIEALI